MADIEVDTKKESISEVHSALPSQPVLVSRPPIEYTSFGALVKSVGRRFASVWTKRFFLSLLSGQLISFCITATSVTTTELVNRGWALPTTQSFFL
jgi:solute carrier family 35, member F1/2